MINFSLWTDHVHYMEQPARRVTEKMEPLNSVELRGLEPGLVEAVGEANEKHSMLPLIKNELKHKILLNRHRHGMGDIELNETKPKVKRELTSEEIQKKLRRKDQNRRAATRCRKKKKLIESQVQLDYCREQQRCADYQKEVEQLKAEKANLLRVLEEHAATCMLAHAPNQLTPDFHGPSVSQFPFTDQHIELFNSETNTTYEDPFDDQFPSTPCQMYSSAPTDYFKPEPEAHHIPIPEVTCTATTGYPDEDLPEDFPELTSGFISRFFPPYSPELILGRQSISEYMDDPETHCGLGL